MSQRQRYTKQFKEEAIRLVNQEGVSLTQVPSLSHPRRTSGKAALKSFPISR